MTEITTLLVPVTDPAASARLYAAVLGREPVDAIPTFVLFAGTGVALGLWKKDGVEPRPDPVAGGMEIGIKLAGFAAVDAAHDAWRALGLKIAMPPRDLDFGRSFVALDPDGHRLRGYCLSDAG